MICLTDLLNLLNQTWIKMKLLRFAFFSLPITIILQYFKNIIDDFIILKIEKKKLTKKVSLKLNWMKLLFDASRMVFTVNIISRQV